MTAAFIGPSVAFGAAAKEPKVPAIEKTPLTPAPKGDAAAASGGMGGSVLRMIVGLVLVVGLALAIWWFVKRAQRRGMPGMGPAGNGLVDVISTTALGPARFLHLVRVGGELILVGATEHTITAVARLTGDDAAEILGDDDVRVDDLQAAFNRGTGRGRDPEPDPVRPPADGDHALVDRLRSLTARR